jgi:hypothetical protein
MLTDTAHADAHVCPCSHPFMYFPTFYTVKSLVERQPHPLEHAYNKWRNEIWDSCKALWTLWVPAQVINFAFVPRYMRVPFGASALAASHVLLLPLFLCLFCVCCNGLMLGQIMRISLCSSDGIRAFLCFFCLRSLSTSWL